MTNARKLTAPLVVTGLMAFSGSALGVCVQPLPTDCSAGSSIQMTPLFRAPLCTARLTGGTIRVEVVYRVPEFTLLEFGSGTELRESSIALGWRGDDDDPEPFPIPIPGVGKRSDLPVMDNLRVVGWTSSF